MRRLNIFAALMLGFCGPCVVLVPAQAAKAQTEVSFAIPPQALSSALIAFSQQAHVQILTSPDAKFSATRSLGVSGTYTAPQALSKLLHHTGFVGKFTDASTVVIDAASRPQSSSTTSARKQNGALYTLQEIEVIAHVPELSATRSNTPIKEIPQTVSVISRNELDQQNATNLASALEFAPGIQLQRTNGEWSAYSRGFSVNSIHIDGGAPIQLGDAGPINAMNRNLAEYDNITVLNGSDALFGGMGAPSATVSMNRKMPTPYFQDQLNMRVGSWDNYRVDNDVSGPITDKLSGRFVASWNRQDYFYNVRHTRDGMFYGVLEYKFTPSTSVAFGGSHQNTHAHGFMRGLPLFDDGADPHLPRSVSLALPWTTMQNSFSEAFANLTHDFNSHWKLQANVTYLKASSPGYLEASYSGPISSATDLLSAGFTPSNSTYSGIQKLGNATLTGSFHWLGNEQKVMLGADYAHNATSGTTLLPNYDQSLTPFDPFNFDPSLFPAPDMSANNIFLTSTTDNTTIQWGVYGSVRLQPIKGLAFILGGRMSEYRSSNNGQLDLPAFGGEFPPTHSAYKDTGKFTPYAGVTYDVGKHYTAYVSLADIYETNAGATTKENVALRPADGNTMEAGVKGAWDHNLLNASIAVFKVDQTGVATYDPSTPPTAGPNCCFLPESIKSKGVQARISGMVTPNWQLLADYTYTKEITNSLISVISPPENVFKLWTNYRIPGGHWSVGGGIRAYSPNHIGTCGTYSPDFSSCLQFIRFSQGTYAVTDLRAAYVVNTHWSVAFNLNNVFDRRYYSMLEALTDNNWYGTPRNFMVTITGKL